MDQKGRSAGSLDYNTNGSIIRRSSNKVVSLSSVQGDGDPMVLGGTELL